MYISLVSWCVLAIPLFHYSDSNDQSRRSPTGLCFNLYHYHQSYTVASKRIHSCAVRAIPAHPPSCMFSLRTFRHFNQTITIFHIHLPCCELTCLRLAHVASRLFLYFIHLLVTAGISNLQGFSSV